MSSTGRVPADGGTLTNRWSVAVAGVILQVALGAVYAWSVFRIPLSKSFGWTITEVTFTFTLSILILGFAAFIGGLWMWKVGPRKVAITAGIFYGAGVFLASFSGGHLWWLYFSYGLLGGIGLGLGYIVPVATLVKWCSDKRGMITGKIPQNNLPCLPLRKTPGTSLARRSLQIRQVRSIDVPGKVAGIIPLRCVLWG